MPKSSSKDKNPSHDEVRQSSDHNVEQSLDAQYEMLGTVEDRQAEKRLVWGLPIDCRIYYLH